MPIRAENKHRYPAHWPQIRATILARAMNRCEFCGVLNHSWIHRRQSNGAEWMSAPHADAQGGPGWTPAIRIILTIAHLDHTPENCDPTNLRALCQRCHLTYDAVHHQRTAYQARRTGRTIRDLFDGQIQS